MRFVCHVFNPWPVRLRDCQAAGVPDADTMPKGATRVKRLPWPGALSTSMPAAIPFSIPAFFFASALSECVCRRLSRL
jgi:hypothetical protein